MEIEPEKTPVSVPTIPPTDASPEAVPLIEASPEVSPNHSVKTRISALQEFFLRADEKLEGRRMRLALSMVLYQAVLAPALDRALSSVRDAFAVASVAKSVGSISFAGLPFFSLIGAVLTLIAGTLIIGGRFSTLMADVDGGGRTEAWRDVLVVTSAEWSMLMRRPMSERFGFLGLSLYTVAATIRDGSRLFRWVVWQGFIEPIGLEKTFIAKPFEWLYYMENLLEMGTLLTLGLSALGLLWWFFSSTIPTIPATLRNVRSVATMPSVLKIGDENARASVAMMFQGEVVRKGLDALATWSPETELNSEKELQASLFKYLLDAGFTVGFEEQLGGRNRVDLTLDGTIAIELKFGALKANERNRAIGQAKVYAERWKGRGPLLVVCVGASGERLTEVVQSVSAWNKQLAEHSGAMTELAAPILFIAQVGEKHA